MEKNSQHRRILLSALIAVILVFSIVGLYRGSDTKDTKTTEDLLTGEIPEKDRESPDDLRTVTFGVWCFWGPDARVGVADGVIRTRVGYWEVKNSTSGDSGITREALQVDYDTEKVSYMELYDMISETGQHRELHPLGEFILAEEHHQSYRLERHETLEEGYKEIYPEVEDFINSTAVARVNGYAAGYGYLQSPDDLEGLGLTEYGMQEVYDIWNSNQN